MEDIKPNDLLQFQLMNFFQMQKSTKIKHLKLLIILNVFQN